MDRLGYTTLRDDYAEMLETAFWRYEKIRKLNVVQFKKIYDKNIDTGIPFDKLVDEFKFD